MAESAGETRPLERLETGVPGLDEVLEGGLFVGASYLVVGTSGAGKTVLGNQLCFHHATAGGRAIFVTLLAESHGRMLANARSLSFFDARAIGQSLYYLSGYPTLEQHGLEGLLQVVLRELRDKRASLLVMDGVETAKPFASHPLDYKRFLHQLRAFGELTGAAVVWTATHQEPPVEATTADGVLELLHSLVSLRGVRQLRVHKHRGSGIVDGVHAMSISSRGVAVHPRFESYLGGPRAAPSVARARASTGVAKLDAMLGGGLFERSSALVLGGSGTGKTLLGLSFLDAGTRAGDPGLYFGFHECAARLVGKASSVGLDPRPALDAGTLGIIWEPRTELLLDELGERVLAEVRSRRVRRLFLDGVGGFRLAAAEPERIPRFFTALLNELRGLGVTTMCSEETTTLFGPEIDLPRHGIAAAVEAIFVLRSLEIRGHLRRFLSILKVRESGYDSAIREIRVGPSGIDLAESLEQAGAMGPGAPPPRDRPARRRARRSP